MRFIFLGAPGAGKGTQTVFLAEHCGIPRISTGDILRDSLKKESLLGLEAKKYMSRGDLVPDEVIIGIIKNCLEQEETQKGFILDGFPRTIEQACALDEMLQKSKKTLDGVIHIEVSVEELTKRILERAKKDKRLDDTKEIIVERLKNYEKEKNKLLDYYKKYGILYFIDGLGTVKGIRSKIQEKLSHLC